MNIRERAGEIWSVADLLRGDYKQADYGKVILPFTVLSRLDILLTKTKEKVLAEWPKVQDMGDEIIDRRLNKIAGYKFHNRSPYNFDKLLADPNNLAANLRAYISGFSTDVRNIMEMFSFDEQIDRLDKSDLLFQVFKKYHGFDLSGSDPLMMGYIFEELIRKFAEISNETAGEHFTPREVIQLIVYLLFTDEEDIFAPGKIITLCDPTAGTGGMLSAGDAHIRSLNDKATVLLFGQEINPESYAICKADMLIKGQEPTNIKFGDTLRNDQHSGARFNYQMANPPFGVEWKKAEKEVKAEFEKRGFAGRFGPGLPRINDGSLLFLLHMISKMPPPQDGGGRIGIVLNGSPLFTGGAGSGESEIRKWIIENDMLEAVVALPDQLFYNTGISTYVWIITNRKSAERKGTVQLINAAGMFQKMSRSLGNKRNEISPEQIQTIAKWYGQNRETSQVKVFPNEYFGYSRITVERPERDEKGNIVTDKKGNPKPDSKLRDYENVPLLEDIETYFAREVLPHVPEAWIDHSKTKVGYEINFTRYFYTYQPLRPLADIRKEILALEQETDGLIKEILE